MPYIIKYIILILALLPIRPAWRLMYLQQQTLFYISQLSPVLPFHWRQVIPSILIAVVLHFRSFTSNILLEFC